VEGKVLLQLVMPSNKAIPITSAKLWRAVDVAEVQRARML
jgi:hypothetical protein